MSMQTLILRILLFHTLCCMPFSVQAQTNTFPVSGNVGIGTTNPQTPLDVSGYLHASGDTNPATAQQGAYLGWNALTGATGETDLINNPGFGTGGFAFMSVPSSGSPRTAQMFIDGNGNVGIGTTSLASRFTVNAGLANIDPSLIYGSSAAFSFQSAQIELAGGVATTTPWAYWLQARGQATNNPWTLALNPSGGNVGIGTITPNAKLEVSGNIRLTAGTGSSITFPDNTVQATAWNGTTFGGDYAESVEVSTDRVGFEPGDVLTIDPAHLGKFLKSATAYATTVAGVYSTKPGLVGRRLPKEKPQSDEVPMAMIGIVPTKVSAENGPIHAGDLVVASSIPGYAMKGTDRDRLIGAIVGKAMGELESGSGMIEVLVTLQ